MTLETNAEKNATTIAIHDQGQAENYQEPFQSGHGLGLAICEMLLAAHGERLTISEQARGGTVAAFQLPLCRNRKSSTDAPTQSPPT